MQVDGKWNDLECLAAEKAYVCKLDLGMPACYI
jgi:hypothetical protein